MPITLISSLALAHLLAAASSSSSKTQTGGGNILIFIIPLLALAYLLIIRPQRQRARKTQQAQSGIEEGDNVVTIGGIVGRVVSLEGDRAVLEVAPDLEVEFLRQAIARRLDPVAVDDTLAEQDRDDDAGTHAFEGADLATAEPVPAEHPEDPDRGWHGFHPDHPGHPDPDPDQDGPGVKAAGEQPSGNGHTPASPVPEAEPGENLGRIYGARPLAGEATGERSAE